MLIILGASRTSTCAHVCRRLRSTLTQQSDYSLARLRYITTNIISIILTSTRQLLAYVHLATQPRSHAATQDGSGLLSRLSRTAAKSRWRQTSLFLPNACARCIVVIFKWLVLYVRLIVGLPWLPQGNIDSDCNTAGRLGGWLHLPSYAGAGSAEGGGQRTNGAGTACMAGTGSRLDKHQMAGATGLQALAQS